MVGPKGRNFMSEQKRFYKVWWKSKTLWVNLAIAALAALEPLTGILQSVLPVNAYVIFAIAVPVVNAMLRVVSNESLFIEKRKEPRNGPDSAS